MAWERRISHTGLNTYRVIRGSTPQDVDAKASAQATIWDERWQRRQDRAAVTRGKTASVSSAERMTIKAQRDLEIVSTTLNRVMALPRSHSWDGKVRAPFTEPPPIQPKASQPISEPDPLYFHAKLGILDRVFAFRRKSKEDAASAKYRSVVDAWKQEVKSVEAANREASLQYQHASMDWTARRQLFAQKQVEEHLQVEAERRKYLSGDVDSLEAYFFVVLDGLDTPVEWPQCASINFVAETGLLEVDFELPPIGLMPTIKEIKYVATKREFREVHFSDTQTRKLYDNVLYQLALGVLHRLFVTDEADAIRAICFNGWVEAIDKSTGVETHPCIMSVQSTKDEFLSLNLSQVDPRACFKKLKGVSGSSLTELSPVRPILNLNRDDSRFVPAYDVAHALDERTNLAAMDWLDFENLIREIFEKEFSKNGGEVKITQASRDGGVDAIAFDPDPIRGGKIVIQAKRYTNVVGVSAVRDLFGTVHNEGATKGILVTTADFGPDAYEFVKGKPLTLLSGSELLHLLQGHGFQAKIDLAEAKRMRAEEAQSS